MAESKTPLAKILIADDEDILREILSDGLKTQYEVEQARNGREAIEKLDESNLVMLDIKMPEMDGIEAGRIIKEKRPDLPIAYMTACDTKQKEIAGKIGNKVLDKPWKSIKALKEEILNLIGYQYKNIEKIQISKEKEYNLIVSYKSNSASKEYAKNFSSFNDFISFIKKNIYGLCGPYGISLESCTINNLDNAEKDEVSKILTSPQKRRVPREKLIEGLEFSYCPNIKKYATVTP